MRLIIVLLALALATPALAQQETNGVDPTGDVAAKLEAQRRDGALASQALRDGDYKLARKYAERVIQDGATDVSAWLLLGQAESGLKDWRSAARTYATAVRMKASSVEAHAGLGIARARRGDADGAAKQLMWLTERAQSCGQACGQITKLKADVEAAIAAGADAG